MTVSHCFDMAIHRVRRAASIPALLLCALLLISASPAAAIGLLRDAGIEYGLTRIAAPVLQAAGLNPKRVRVLVVNDHSLNAFVVDGQAIFLHYGLIRKLDNVRMLQAVIAHEAAHIANGHIARRLGNMRSARTAAGLGVALAAAAAAAGAGEAASGIAIGTQSAAMRGFFKHTRAEESSADRSAAHYMMSSGIDPRGMVEVHQIFRGQELVSEGRQDPYMRSHPLTRDRIRAAEAVVAGYGAETPADAEAQYWYDRVRGILTAFTRSPSWTMDRLKREKSPDIRAMREAIAWHRQSNSSRAIAAIDRAIAARPGDPFYRDLKGQFLLESRQTRASVSAYRNAAELAPRDALIRAGLGRALLADNRPKEALNELEAARRRDPANSRMLRDMSVAYAKTGQTGMAALVTAERYAAQGRLRDALPHAKRADGLLPRGSAPWLRAQDVLGAAEKYLKRR